MSFLVRSRVGDFSLDAAHTPEELSALGEAAVEPPEKYLGHLQRHDLPGARAGAFMNGLPTHIDGLSGEAGPLAVFSGGAFLGIGRYEEASASLVPEKVYKQ